MNSDVLIVGAGCCGLATAIGLQRQGLEVTLLELRQHPRRSKRELEQVRAAIRSDDPRRYPDASRIWQGIWGCQQRNVIMDSHCVRHLQSLGVCPDDLAQVRYSLMRDSSGPTVRFEYSERTEPAETLSLDLEQMLLNRDWTCIAPLGVLEHALFDQATSLPGVQVLFGTAATGLSESAGRVEVRTDSGEFTARFVVITDGGGKSSLAGRLGVKRKIYKQDRMSFAVVEQTRKGKTPEGAFVEMGFNQPHWYGIFGSGRAVSGAIPIDRKQNSSDSFPALDYLRERGWHGRLVEPPIEIDILTAEAREICLSPGVVLAGDAAATGDPRSGLGFQMAMYWSRFVCHQLDRESLTVKPKAFRSEGARIAGRRRSGELGLLDLYDAGMHVPVELSALTFSSSVLNALSKLDLDLERDTGGRFAGKIRARLAEKSGEPDKQEHIAGLLRFLGVIEIAGKFRLRTDVDAKGNLLLCGRITAKRTITIRAGAQTLVFHEGRLSLRFGNRRWRLLVEDGVARQLLKKKAVGSFAVERLRVNIPNQFVNRLTAYIPSFFESLPCLPVTMCTHIEAGNSLSIGSLEFAANGAMRIAIQIHATPNLEVRLKILEGRIRLAGLGEEMSRRPITATRWVRELGALLGESVNEVVDAVTGIAAIGLREVRVQYAADGSAIVSIHFPTALEFAVAAEEANEIVTELFEFSQLSRIATGIHESIYAVSVTGRA